MFSICFRKLCYLKRRKQLIHLDHQNENSLLTPSLPQQLVLVLCFYQVIERQFSSNQPPSLHRALIQGFTTAHGSAGKERANNFKLKDNDFYLKTISNSVIARVPYTTAQKGVRYQDCPLQEGPGASPPENILKFKFSEMRFPTFCGQVMVF